MLHREGQKNSRWAYSVFLAALLFLAACGNPTPQTIIVQIYNDTPTPVALQASMVPANATPGATPTRSSVAPTLSAASVQTCPLVRLAPGQNISASGSYTMTEDDAAGPMVCRIQRDSCAFGLLMTDRDPEIQFGEHKPPPLTDEDRMIHPAMLLPLSRLRQMVQDEWSGSVRLYVTAAYDSTGEHDLAQTDLSRKYSLHFEGRSIDLVTSPSDPAKTDRLCALASCAGFDWVNNEGDHCHASIKAESLCSFCSGSVPPTATPPSTPPR